MTVSRTVSARPASSSYNERDVFKLQILLVLVVAVLLNVGGAMAREWRRTAEQNQLQTNVLFWDGLAWYVWVAAAPLMLVLIRKFPLGSGQLRRNGGAIVLGSLGIYLLVANARYGLRMLPNLWLPPEHDLPTDLSNYLYNTYRVWPFDFLVFCGFFGISFSLDYFFKYRQRAEESLRLQVEAAKLQSDLARAELAALRGQLHPHFLFNSFNSIATMVRQQKNGAAVETIARLSALLRLAIDRTTFQEIPLAQELDFIRRYLDLEHVRFGEKLQVDFAVDPSTLGVLVPNILLQPLVENAIKHGISRRTEPGAVRVAANRQQGRLHLEIVNDGVDDPPSASSGESTGIGLPNTRARLTRLYGNDYRMNFIRRPAGGMLVALDLPWRLGPEQKSAYE